MILFLSQGILISLQIEEFEGLDYPEKSVNHVPERVLTISPVCTAPKNHYFIQKIPNTCYLQ